MPKHNTPQNGYTFLELSVVIMILALVAGGIYVAQAMVRTSHLNRILSEYDTTIKAFSEFHEKYYAYPGDMNNAESFWGSDAGCPTTAYNIVPKIPTCNGNGDGKIGNSTTGGVSSLSHEWFRAWQHMANAGFLNGQFTGAQGPDGPYHAVPGVNVLGTSIKGAGWTLFYLNNTTSNLALWPDQYGHLLILGAEGNNAMSLQPFISGSEARALDAKIDDGRPGTGYIRAFRTSVLPNCTMNDTSQTAQSYNTSNNSLACSLFFITGY